MTRNEDGTYSIKASTLRWAIGTIITVATAVGGIGGSIVWGWWQFSSDMRADVAVIKTRCDSMQGDIHDLKDWLRGGIDERRAEH